MNSEREAMIAAEGWDEYVKFAQRYLRTGTLREDEYDYKIEIGNNTAAARDSVLEGQQHWAQLLESALVKDQPIPWRGRTFRKFNSWFLDRPSSALEALRAIWTADLEPNDESIHERIHSFGQIFTSDVISGHGTRATIASALLMGLNVEEFPPFRKGKFSDAYKFTGYEELGSGANEATLYKHALGFLDQFLVEAEKRGLDWPYRNRLAAQSVVWQISGRVEKRLREGTIKGDSPSKVGIESNGSALPSLSELADNLFFPLSFLREIETLLMEKRQVIFQGPPGTGKTYVARALANHYAGSVDHVTFVQFHPSYAYEDFVRGFRPKITMSGHAAFELQDGPLLVSAEKARTDAELDPSTKHLLVIDEINRGNIAKVFGELYYLLEYRDEEISLQYQQKSGEFFSLPKNLYVIGTMNTADRSIALVDLALRRRFYFIEFHPDKEPVRSVLRKWLGEESKLAWVADVVDEANELLKDDRHAAIGPSYFMKNNLREEDVPRIWKHSVLPYIEERLFGDDNRIEEFELSKLKARAEQTRRQRQQTGQSGDDANSDAESLNNEADRPSGVSGQ